MDELLLVVDLGVEIVEVLDEIAALEWERWLLKFWVLSLDLLVEFVPFLVESFSILFILLDGILLLLVRVHLEGLIKSKRIDFFEDGLESNQRFLEDLMPVILSKIDNDWNKHWECLLLVSLQDVQEVIILKEAHCSVSNLKVDTSNALNDSLEKFWNKVLNLVNFTDFKNLLQLSQE